MCTGKQCRLHEKIVGGGAESDRGVTTRKTGGGGLLGMRFVKVGPGVGKSVDLDP